MPWLRWIIGLYGFVNFAGGLMGFVFGKSVASLVAGCISGALLIACAVVAGKNPALGYRGAGGLTLLLLLFWAYEAFVKVPMSFPPRATQNFALALVMIILLGTAHVRAAKKTQA